LLSAAASCRHTRFKRQLPMAMHSTSASSAAPSGASASSISPAKRANPAASSSKVRTCSAASPWRSALSRALAFPPSVFGPVLFFAFARLAAICASVAMFQLQFQMMYA